MVGKDIDPSDIGKHPRLIKAAQQDMTQMDVLVCGKCHTVFHFIDLFKEHKEQSCIKESNLKESREQKPKVWAFLLWKAAQLNNNTNNKDLSGHMNSWKLYQTWVKMEDSVRETWVVAGKTIQSFARMGQGNLQEMPVKITKTVVDTAPNKLTPTNRLPTTYNRNLNKKDDTDDEPSPIKTEQPKKIIRPTLTPVNTPNQQIKPTSQLTTSTPIPRLNAFNRRATRTLPGNTQETEMETVEKIVAKRFNPRRKMHEYLVKWEGFTHEQNTWEPQIHLECCSQLLETFEKQLARQKEQRAQAAAVKQQQQGNIQLNPIKSGDEDNKQQQQQRIQQQNIIATSSSGLASPQSRLLRTTTAAAQKSKNVMDQVKQWIEKDDKMSTNSGLDGSESSIGGGGGIKRKLDDSSDFDGINTAGEEEDFEEDAIPVHAVKRLKNGTTVTTTKVDPKSDAAKSPTIIKTINVNGTIKTSQSISDNSADIVITKDTANTGIVRKVGVSPNSNNQKPEAQIRVISKGENTTSGIVRINSTTSSNSSGTINTIQQKTLSAITTTTTPGGQQRITQIINKTPVRSTTTTPQVHRITVNSKDTTQSTQPTTVKSLMQQSSLQQQQQPQKTITQRLTPTQQVRQIQTQPRQATIIQRTSLSPNTSSTNIGQSNSLTTSPQSGKMIINRNIKNSSNNNVNNNTTTTTTPEQKIMQLSKTGDIKVTRKTITQQSPQHQQQQQVQTQPKVLQMGQRRPQQQQQQQQHQKQISTARSKLHQQQQQRSESPPNGGLTLCPVTGKILTETGEEVQTIDKKDDSGILQQNQLHLQQEQQAAQELAEGLSLTSEGQQILANEDGTPLLVTGEDGTIYQVAGKNAEGQTILIAQGADGEQQYAYVAAADDGDESNHGTSGNNTGSGGVLTLDNAVAEAVAQMLPDQNDQLSGIQGDIGQFIIKQDDGTLVTATTAGGNDVDEHDTLDPSQALTIQTDAGDSQDANIPAEVVQADLPSPGGTRRVILLLQDGTFMMTEMHDDEYQALNIT